MNESVKQTETLGNQLSQIKSCDAMEEIQNLVYAIASNHPDAGKSRRKEGDSTTAQGVM